MADLREDILVRLLAILNTLGAEKVERNVKIVDDVGQFPALLMFDGDEETRESDFVPGSPANKLVRMEANPHIHILLGESPEDVGTQLNKWRARVIKGFTSDADLIKLLTTNGGIRYEGLVTSLHLGRTIVGEMGLAFIFVYPLRPAEL